MKINKSLIIALSIIFMMSCRQKNVTVAKTRIGDQSYIEKITRQALSGDKEAYTELSNIYMIENRCREIFYVSTVVSNKFSNPDASFMVYWCLIHPEIDPDLDSVDAKHVILRLDPKTKFSALFFLLKAKELGHSSANYNVKELYTDSASIPKSSDYWDSLSIEMKK